MNTTASRAAAEPGKLRGASAPLAVMIATNLANAHGNGQRLADLAALAFALAHDALLRKR